MDHTKKGFTFLVQLSRNMYMFVATQTNRRVPLGREDHICGVSFIQLASLFWYISLGCNVYFFLLHWRLLKINVLGAYWPQNLYLFKFFFLLLYKMARCYLLFLHEDWGFIFSFTVFNMKHIIYLSSSVSSLHQTFAYERMRIQRHIRPYLKMV